MKKTVSILLIVFIFGCASPMKFLREYRGKYNLALIFANNENKIESVRTEITKRRKQFGKKHILFLYLYENGQSWFENRPLTSNLAFSLRERFKVPDKISTLVLLGRNGKEILRQTAGIDLRQILDIVK